MCKRAGLAKTDTACTLTNKLIRRLVLVLKSREGLRILSWSEILRLHNEQSVLAPFPIHEHDELKHSEGPLRHNLQECGEAIRKQPNGPQLLLRSSGRYLATTLPKQKEHVREPDRNNNQLSFVTLKLY